MGTTGLLLETREEQKLNCFKNMKLLTLTPLSVFFIMGMASFENVKSLMMGIEPLSWSPSTVESSTAKCQIKRTKVCRKKLGKAVMKCRGLKIECVMEYFSNDNDENCNIKCGTYGHIFSYD